MTKDLADFLPLTSKHASLSGIHLEGQMASTQALMAEISTSSASADRRASARSRSCILVTPQDGTSPLWAVDIGLGGMQVKSRTTRFPGTYLDVQFALPDTREKIRLTTQVVNLGRRGDDGVYTGLRFCRVAKNDQLAIYRFLDRRRLLWEDEKRVSHHPVVVTRPIADNPSRVTTRHPALALLLNQDQPFLGLLEEAREEMQKQAQSRSWFARLWN